MTEVTLALPGTLKAGSRPPQIWNSSGMSEAAPRSHSQVPPARGVLWALSEGLGDSRDIPGVAGTGCEAAEVSFNAGEIISQAEP